MDGGARHSRRQAFDFSQWDSLPEEVRTHIPDDLSRLRPRRLQQAPDLDFSCGALFPPQDCRPVDWSEDLDCSAATCPLEAEAATNYEDCVCAAGCQAAVMVSQCTSGYALCDSSCHGRSLLGCPPSCALDVGHFQYCRCTLAEARRCLDSAGAATQQLLAATCSRLPRRDGTPADPWPAWPPEAEGAPPPQDWIAPPPGDADLFPPVQPDWPDAAPPAEGGDKPPVHGLPSQPPPSPPVAASPDAPPPPAYGGVPAPPPAYGTTQPPRYGSSAPPVYGGQPHVDPPLSAAARFWIPLPGVAGGQAVQNSAVPEDGDDR
ncbi:hypothetical protein HYH03_017509 [Edaphochlamys debaryana]|uniref:Uncharacterized protein n=1 Tax=Edaphochlamys debaryana TaxID=47281 RepID=A0A835XH30_9CHLO|nr:hypothetical protein HYH03_017509 [Edaphochlamys debaryana]|eukprot:KAG2483631.1 hypothetical protein HYH03_017509 [Edaphochlamys debaryana]